MGFSDKFKKVTERAQQLAEQAAGEVQEAAETAKHKTAELASENRERIGSAIDKTAAVVSEKTGDKYAEKIDSARAKAHQGLDKVADADGNESPGGDASIPGSGSSTRADAWASTNARPFAGCRFPTPGRCPLPSL